MSGEERVWDGSRWRTQEQMERRREYQREYRREKRRTDPAWAEQERERQREWKRNNPKRATSKEKLREYNQRWYKKLDPEKKALKIARGAERQRERRRLAHIYWAAGGQETDTDIDLKGDDEFRL